MPSNSSLKKEVKKKKNGYTFRAIREAESRDAEKIAELEARLKEKEDYISQSRAIRMVKDFALLDHIEKTVKDKKRKKRKRINLLMVSLVPGDVVGSLLRIPSSPIEVENSARPSVLKKNKIKIKRKDNLLLKYVVEEVNLLEDMAKKLKPPKKTYSNDDIFIKRSQYHMDKIKEKNNLIEENKEIATLNKRIAQKNELLKDIEWRVRCSIGNTYQAKLQWTIC